MKDVGHPVNYKCLQAKCKHNISNIVSITLKSFKALNQKKINQLDHVALSTSTVTTLTHSHVQ